MRIIEKRKNGRLRVALECTEPSRTQQQFKEGCDVNKIVAKYKTTGQWQHLTGKEGVFADVTKITDYETCMNKVLRANSAFEALPSNIRLRFQNDPAQLLAFMQDPKNHEEGIKLGLYEQPKAKSEHTATNAKTTNANTAKSEQPAKGKNAESNPSE